MKVAIIEDNRSYQKLIRSIAKHFDWDVDYFFNATDFGRAPITKYDVIVTDYELPVINGRELIKSIASKTTAQILLMSDFSESFIDEDIKNERIKGLIDKGNPQSIVSELKYVDSKLKLKSVMEHEKDNLESIFPTNGYSLKETGGVCLVTMAQAPTERTRNRLLEEVSKNGTHKIVLSFSGKEIANSPYLSFIIFLHKKLKKLSGHLVLWTNDELLIDQMKLCKLTLMIPILGTFKKAISYLKRQPTVEKTKA